jgi:hypothetical protein
MKCKLCKREMGIGEDSSKYCDGYCTQCYAESEAELEVTETEPFYSMRQ